MKDLSTLFIVFGGIFLIIPIISNIYKLDIKIDDYNCKEEVNGVKKNKISTIILYSIGVILILIGIILFIL